MKRPRIGISACLAGQPVRYDGTHKYLGAACERLAADCDLVPLCPEAALGIPRPPVQLVAGRDGLRACGVADPTLDVTAALQAFAEAQRPLLAGLDGLVLKARSPSCGIGNAPWHDADGRYRGLRHGLFAAFVAEAFPALVLVDEDALQDPVRYRAFLHRIGCGPAPA